MPNKIAYQGEPGANSDIACRDMYPDMEPLPCATFEDALNAITSGKAKFGMIAIENSIAGRVADVHHLMPNYNLHIVGEYFLPIHFHLLGLPGSKIEDIKTVHSHVHALGQCRKIIRKLGLIGHVAGDTAGSAREVAEWGDKSKASLATKLAGELYGLKVLAENVADEPNNTTRFVVLSKQPLISKADKVPLVTSFIFRVRNVPAALYKALGGFATNGINMTKLESYMVNGEFSATQFLADVDGHPDDKPLKLALEELAFFSKEVRILGTYPAAEYRIKSQKRAAT